MQKHTDWEWDYIQKFSFVPEEGFESYMGGKGAGMCKLLIPYWQESIPQRCLPFDLFSTTKS
jgi:hypothetical protein